MQASAEWIGTDEAAKLLQVSPRHVQRLVARGDVQGAMSATYRSGKSYAISTASLPEDVRVRLALRQEGLQDADIASYLLRFGPEKLNVLMDKLYAVKELQLLRGDKRSAQRRAELAAQFGVKPRCLYDWERKYEAEGLEGLMDKTMRSDKGKSRSLCLLAQARINYLYMASGKLNQNRVHHNLLEMRDKLGPAVCEECCHNPASYNRADMLARGQDPGEECRACGGGLVVAESRCAVNRYLDFVGDQMDQRSWTRMMREVLSAAREHCRPGAILAIFIDWRNLPTLYDAIQWAGWSLRGLVVWDKLTSRPQPGRFRQQTEYLVWASNGPLPLDRGVGCLPGIVRATNVQGSKRLHQTQKPLEIMREIVRITAPGGRILDPFAGSGTTLAAAQLEGYDALGCEVHRAIAATAAQRLDVPLLPLSALPDAPELPPPDAQGASV